MKLASLFSGALGRLAKNWALIFSGNMVSAGLAIVAVAIAARALDPTVFGTLVIIQTYARLVDGVLNFQSAQALIKFGTDAQVSGKISAYLGLMKFGAILDGATAIFTLFAAWAGIFVFASMLGLEDSGYVLAFIYCLVIPTNLTGMPTAALRLSDRFGLVVYREMTNQALRVVGGVALWLMDAGLTAFVLLWLLSEAAGNILLYVLAMRELLRRGYRLDQAASIRKVASGTPGLWPALINTNLTTGIRLLSEEGDVLIVGSVLGAASAGAYKIAKQFASILLRVGRPLQEAVYPPLARLWSEGNRPEFRRLSVKIGMLSGCAAVVIWAVISLLSGTIVELVVGSEYESAGGLLIVLAFSHVIYMFGITILPTTLSMNRSHDWLVVTLVSTALFFSVFPIFIWNYGSIGAGISHIVYNITWLSMSVFLISRALSRRGS